MCHPGCVCVCVLVGKLMEGGHNCSKYGRGDVSECDPVKDKEDTRILAQHMTTIAVCELCLEQGSN